MGEKQIANKQKEISKTADKIRTKLDSAEELEPGVLGCDQISARAERWFSQTGNGQVGQIIYRKKEAKAFVSARPKLAFETFSGDVSQYPTFLTNQEELYKVF